MGIIIIFATDLATISDIIIIIVIIIIITVHVIVMWKSLLLWPQSEQRDVRKNSCRLKIMDKVTAVLHFMKRKSHSDV